MRNKASFFIGFISRSLRREGQRSLLALFCIAFGVFSLVSMQILSDSINASVSRDPRLTLGGDLVVSHYDSAPISKDDVAVFDSMQKDGTVSAYTLVSHSSGQLIKVESSGRAYVVSRTLGVDPAHYPLVGSITLKDGSSLDKELSETGSAIITQDIADTLSLQPGSHIVLSGSLGGAPVSLMVSAIATTTPEGRGDTLYVSLETSKRLLNVQNPGNQVYFTGDEKQILPNFPSGGWSVETKQDSADQSKSVSELFGFMLKGVGLLGLLVGGIGIANTLQVLMARRRQEIAVLKTVGYRQRDLLTIYGLETAAIGLIGSVLGAVAALGISSFLTNALEKTGTIMVETSIRGSTVATGIAMGTATALIFGLFAITKTSSLRPAFLLRDLPTRTTLASRVGSAFLIVILFLIFSTLAGSVLGSPLLGLSAVGGTAVALFILAIILGGAFMLLIWLPIPLPGVARLSRNSLRKQKFRSVFALIALFLGVAVIGFVANTLLTAQNRVNGQRIETSGSNLTINVSRSQEESMLSRLRDSGASAIILHYQERMIVQKNGDTKSEVVEAYVGPQSDLSFTTEGSAWGSHSGFYVSDGRKDDYPIGSRIKAADEQGRTIELPVVGTYTIGDYESPLGDFPRGLVVDTAEAIPGLSGDSGVIVSARVDPSRLQDVENDLSTAFPSSTVLSLEDVNELLTRMITNLFTFVISIAGLAFAAGAVLIANTAGLSMLERRREMGILKAIGFSNRQALATVLLEYGLLGLVAGLLGVGFIYIAIPLLNHFQPNAQLKIYPLPTFAMAVLTTIIAVGSAWSVAWHSAKVRPLEVLRNE